MPAWRSFRAVDLGERCGTPIFCSLPTFRSAALPAAALSPMYGLKSSSSHICDHSGAPRRMSALVTMTQRIAVVGGKMTRPLGFVLALFIVGSVSPAKAGGNTNVKCAPNEDRVWVYESLDDFNVAAKLKCGDPVQIVGRVKGYVKIETANGTDGYVLDSALPKSALPPEPEEKPNTVEAASLAFAARRAAKSSANSANPAPSASSTSAVASSAPVTVASKPAPAAQPAVAPVQPQPEVTMTASAPAPAASSSNQPATAPIAAPVVATAPAPAASSAPVARASTQPTPSQPAPGTPKAVAKYSNPQPVRHHVQRSTHLRPPHRRFLHPHQQWLRWRALLYHLRLRRWRRPRLPQSQQPRSRAA